MASMVANTNIGADQAFRADKSSRNKRKFRPDPPLNDQNMFNNSPICEFPYEKTESTQTYENYIGCKMCNSLSNDQKHVTYDFGDWTDFTETELKELVLNNLERIFITAIKKVVACGYNEEVVKKSVLRSGVYHGPKDIMANIVDNTLSFIRNGHEIDSSKEHYFENLAQLEKYVLPELVCIICELRPSFSTGDALWCLLLCDMNINNACTLNDISSSVVGPSEITPLPLQTVTKTETPSSEFCFSASSKPDFVKPKKSSVSPISFTGNETKPVCARNISGLRQKMLHTERGYRTYSSKGSSRSGKRNSFSKLVIDKKLKSVTDSAGINFKTATLKITKPTVVEKQRSPLASAGCTTAHGAKSKEGTDFVDKPRETETKIDTKDLMLMRLLPREQVLRAQLGKWDEWANRKVMQVAKKLGKDKAELKALKEEKEEAEKGRREKQTLKESTRKKVMEMESAFCKVGREMEWASGAIKRLERENERLRRENEEARRRGKEGDVILREGVRREKEVAARVVRWEKERGLFRDELVVEKRKVEKLDREVELAIERMDREEARLKQEEKAKEKLLKEANLIRTETEKLEASAKAQGETIKSNAETNLKKYKDDIQMLEKEISELRLKNESSKIAALRQGVEHTNPKKAYNRDTSRKIFANLEDEFSGVKRERECVMCLSEEMSVVFLPCAHQIVCSKCNELHEKQGMKDCPSCRGTIQQRISVRYAGR